MRRGILASGNWITDAVKTIDRWPSPGMLATIRSVDHGAGGAPYNVLMDLAAMNTGIPLYAHGFVGDDASGREILRDVAVHGIDTAHLRALPGTATSFCDVMTEESSGRRTFFSYRGASSLLDNDAYTSLPDAAIFHLGYLLLLDGLDAPDAEYGVVAARVLHRMQQAGFRTSIDVVSEDSDRFHSVVTPCLPYVDYCIVNEIEAARITGYVIRTGDGTIDDDALSAAAAKIIASGAHTAVIHFPEGGYGATQSGETLFVPSFTVRADEIRGTVGAGDAFCAGCLYGFHEGLSLGETMRIANAAARFNLLSPTSVDGAVPIDVLKLFCDSAPVNTDIAAIEPYEKRSPLHSISVNKNHLPKKRVTSDRDNGDVVIFGAGNIGRGLVAERVSSAGYRPVFVEAYRPLADMLRAAGKYDIHLVGQHQSKQTISDFDIIDAGDTTAIAEHLSCCAFAVTCVGGDHLPSIAPVIAYSLKARGPHLNIIVCENLPHADSVLADALKKAGANNFSAVRTSVERMVRRDDATLTLIGESGQSLYVDRTAWHGELPDIDGMDFTKHIEAYYARKIFTNNAGHALLAYIGALRGHTYIHDAMSDGHIAALLDELLVCSGKALVHSFVFSEAEMNGHISLVSHRFANRELADTIARVARDPLRKLSPGERLMGLIHVLVLAKLPTAPVARVIGAALHYFDPADAASIRMKTMIETDGVEHVLSTVCGMHENDVWYQEAINSYNENKTKGEKHYAYATNLS